MKRRGTRDVASLLGIRPSALTRAVWEGRLEAPEMGPGRAFCWSEKNIRQACWILLHRDLDDVLAERGEGGGP